MDNTGHHVWAQKTRYQKKKKNVLTTRPMDGKYKKVWRKKKMENRKKKMHPKLMEIERKRGSCLKWFLNELGLFCGSVDLLSTSYSTSAVIFSLFIYFLLFITPCITAPRVSAVWKGQDETICGTINGLFDLQTGPRSTGQIDTLLTVVAFVVGTAMCHVSYTGVVSSIADYTAITIRDSTTTTACSSALDQSWTLWRWKGETEAGGAYLLSRTKTLTASH